MSSQTLKILCLYVSNRLLLLSYKAIRYFLNLHYLGGYWGEYGKTE